MKLAEHPTVVRMREKAATTATAEPVPPLDADWIRGLAIAAGADDVGFVAIDRPELDDQRDDLLRHLPGVRALVSFVVRTNREPIRSPARSVANIEFHHAGERVNAIGRALNSAMGFPMEMDAFPGKLWLVSHKPVAEAAGLGRMGIHRNVIHPKSGNFVLLGTVMVAAEISEESRPLDYDPCLECKLCVAACPVGAIAPDGRFDFSACYTHNYREFMGGFTDWVEQVAESHSAINYRKRVSDSESAAKWQSLSFGANYKAAYCLSVCPAGEDVIGPYLSDKKAHLNDVVRPLQQKEETIYVLRNSDAERHVARRFRNKRTKLVGNSLRPRSLDQFLGGLSLVFQRDKSKGLDARYHFTFTGREKRQATFVIRNGTLSIDEGHEGDADLRVTADSETWLGFLAGERNLVWALLTRKIKLRGSPRLLVAFGNCFPG